MRLGVLSLLLVSLLVPMGLTRSAEEFAQQFLDAWVFHDHAAMHAQMTPGRQASLTGEGLARRLEALPILAQSAEIVSVTSEGTVAVVRYRIHGTHATSGQDTSIAGTLRAVPNETDEWLADFEPPQVAPVAGGPTIEELVERLAGNARQFAPNSLPPTQVIDGMTIEGLIDAATQSHADIKALQMNLRITGRTMGQGFDMSGTFHFQDPDKIRFDVGEVLFVSDGTMASMYLRPANAHVRIPLMGAQGHLMTIAPGIGATAQQHVRASLIGREITNGRTAWHIAVSPEGSGAGVGIADLTGMMGNMNVWLDTETLLPLRAQMGGMGATVQLDFSDVVVNPDSLPDDAFVFQPPPGSMSLPMMLPGLGG